MTPSVVAVPQFETSRRLAAEGLGTAFLLTAVVGSGIAAERLADGNVALALLCNAAATAASLVVLITILGPISGAHVNPAVTMVMALRRTIEPRLALAYAGVQVAGAIAGVALAHAMAGAATGLALFGWMTERSRRENGRWPKAS